MTEINGDKVEDWANRILCSDESCIGTIGSDKKCRECGKPYEGELTAEDCASSEHAVMVDEQSPVSLTTETEPDDWEKRVLCSDESCIGIIGPDGKCKECGQLLKKP